MKRKHALLVPLLLIALQTVTAQGCDTSIAPLNDMMVWLAQIANPIGLLMMIYMGIKWSMAEGAEDRENARRGIIYVVIGLLLVQVSDDLIIQLYCMP